MPLVLNGDSVSLGIVFLFTVIWILSNIFSASLPVIPKFPLTSANIKWLSVPPDIILKPSLSKVLARAWAFLITCLPYSLNSGCKSS